MVNWIVRDHVELLHDPYFCSYTKILVNEFYLMCTWIGIGENQRDADILFVTSINILVERVFYAETFTSILLWFVQGFN